jgi:phosphoribosylanthranilate isomerase
MVNPDIQEVKEVSDYCDSIQLHGNESNQFIKQIKKLTNLHVIKAIKVAKQIDLQNMEHFHDADEVLLDTPAMGQSGEAFNFDLLKQIKNKKFFLAGKIDINNVKTALKYTDKIDVNSGLETEKGIKDPKKIKEFFKMVHKL